MSLLVGLFVAVFLAVLLSGLIAFLFAALFLVLASSVFLAAFFGGSVFLAAALLTCFVALFGLSLVAFLGCSFTLCVSKSYCSNEKSCAENAVS